MDPRGDRLRFALAVAALLVTMAAAMTMAALEENDTYDEAGHLAAGYAYLVIQDYGFNAEHPPLGNMLSALPLLVLRPRLPVEHPAWRMRAAPVAGALFLYRNRVRPDVLLLAGRAVTMLFALLLGLVIALWARRHFSPAAALLSLFLFASDPNFLAHGHYVTTDLFAAFFIFCACLVWLRYLSTQRLRDLLLAGLVAGAALAVKFSAIVLWPIFALLDLARNRRLRAASGLRLVIVAVLALFVIGLSYWSETWQVLRGELPLSRHSFLLGLGYLAEHNRAGRPSYLLGEVADHGWWYYFPIAFLVKTPSVLLVLSLVALVGALGRRLAQSGALLLPAAVYFALSLTSNLNLGIRHLLPVYPFLFVLAGAAVFHAGWSRRTRLALVALAAAFQLAESVRAHPHYLAFFNSFVGGSAGGWRYLADSNLDWGQDIKKLKKHLDRLGVDEVCLAYFGTTDVAYHGLRRRPLPTSREVASAGLPDCVAAISMNLLLGLYVEPGSYDWLRSLPPDAVIGHSIRVYDLRKARRAAPSEAQPQARRGPEAGSVEARLIEGAVQQILDPREQAQAPGLGERSFVA